MFAQVDTHDLEATVEHAQAESAGLPQLAVFEDGSFTNQIAWLVLTFLVLYIVVSRIALPKLSALIEDRETRLQDDLGKAEHDRKKADEVKQQYEASLLSAKANAQKVLAEARANIQATLTAETKTLDEKLGDQTSKAEAEVMAAKAKALEEIQDVASEATADMFEKLTGQTITAAKLAKAVKASATSKTGE